MTPPRHRSDEAKKDINAIVRVAMLVWRTPAILGVVALLVGLNGGGAVSTYFSSKKPTTDSLMVVNAVTEAMDPVRDTVRELRRDLGEVDRKVDRVAVQADKTDGDFRSHLLAYSWPSRMGRGSSRMQ